MLQIFALASSLAPSRRLVHDFMYSARLSDSKVRKIENGWQFLSNRPQFGYAFNLSSAANCPALIDAFLGEMILARDFANKRASEYINHGGRLIGGHC